MWVWSVWSKTSPPCRLVSVAGAARAIVPSASRVVVSTLMWLVGRRRRAGCTGYRERAGTLPTVHTRRCAGSALRAPATPLSLNLCVCARSILPHIRLCPYLHLLPSRLGRGRAQSECVAEAAPAGWA
ncbi:hypothetical protein B0H19DRAFT_527458 [Mycena capillaripes]|nr:hypothetical protein B0H19DRAFT_527458 [Mycena capillaripes]